MGETNAAAVATAQVIGRDEVVGIDFDEPRVKSLEKDEPLLYARLVSVSPHRDAGEAIAKLEKAQVTDAGGQNAQTAQALISQRQALWVLLSQENQSFRTPSGAARTHQDVSNARTVRAQYESTLQSLREQLARVDNEPVYNENAVRLTRPMLEGMIDYNMQLFNEWSAKLQLLEGLPSEQAARHTGAMDLLCESHKVVLEAFQGGVLPVESTITAHRAVKEAYTLPTSVAMVGQMKAGKSSAVDATVGLDLSAKRTEAMTVMPTRYVHMRALNQPRMVVPMYKQLNKLLDQIRSIPAEKANALANSLPRTLYTLLERVRTQAAFKFGPVYSGLNIKQIVVPLHDIIRLVCIDDVKELLPPNYMNFIVPQSPEEIVTVYCTFPTLDGDDISIRTAAVGEVMVIDTPGFDESTVTNLQLMDITIGSARLSSFSVHLMDHTGWNNKTQEHFCGQLLSETKQGGYGVMFSKVGVMTLDDPKYIETARHNATGFVRNVADSLSLQRKLEKENVFAVEAINMLSACQMLELIRSIGGVKPAFNASPIVRAWAQYARLGGIGVAALEANYNKPERDVQSIIKTCELMKANSRVTTSFIQVLQSASKASMSSIINKTADTLLKTLRTAETLVAYQQQLQTRNQQERQAQREQQNSLLRAISDCGVEADRQRLKARDSLVDTIRSACNDIRRHARDALDTQDINKFRDWRRLTPEHIAADPALRSATDLLRAPTTVSYFDYDQAKDAVTAANEFVSRAVHMTLQTVQRSHINELTKNVNNLITDIYGVASTALASKNQQTQLVTPQALFTTQQIPQEPERKFPLQFFITRSVVNKQSEQTFGQRLHALFRNVKAPQGGTAAYDIDAIAIREGIKSSIMVYIDSVEEALKQDLEKQLEEVVKNALGPVKERLHTVLAVIMTALVAGDQPPAVDLDLLGDKIRQQIAKLDEYLASNI